jgi:mannose-6-phosphate isomerase
MTIELAAAHPVRKPWGRTDLAPWSTCHVAGARVGEIRFERPDPDAPRPALLLKLLFTDEPLSIQVHPDDAFARSIGLDNGKSEAWYVLDAHPHAGVGVGLGRRLSASRLRSAIADRSIASLIAWRRVREGDVVSVPAGMIHTIGAGLVLAEIQQRSDATFRLFDHDRARGIHTEQAIAASNTSLHADPPIAVNLGNGRSIMVAAPHFVLERLVLPPNAVVEADAPSETWLLVIDGGAAVGPVQAGRGEAVYANATRAMLTAGASGATILLAYGGPEPRLARGSDARQADRTVPDRAARMLEAGA